MKIDEIKRKILPILFSYGVKKASIAGSVARNEEKRNSDIDIIIEAGKDMSLLTFSRLKLELENVLNKKVDLIERSALKSRLKKHLLKDEIEII